MVSTLSREADFGPMGFSNGRLEFSDSETHKNDPNEKETFYKQIIRKIVAFQETISALWIAHKLKLKWVVAIVLLALFHIYLIFAMIIKPQEAIILVVITAAVWGYLLYSHVIIKRIVPILQEPVGEPLKRCYNFLWNKWYFRLIIYLLLVGAVVTFLIIDTKGERHRLISLGGLIFYLAVLLLFSKHPTKVNWRPVVWGIGLQFLLGLIILRWHSGFLAFTWISDRITQFLDYVHYGTSFVFGFLVDPPNICGMFPVFTFAILPVLIYFSSFVAILYHIGAMQFILDKVGWIFQKTMGTTIAESMCAAADIFFGMSEAPIMISPYIGKMTKSELHAVMTSGFSTIAGSLFAAYASFGACPLHLLSHSVMAAPAALGVSKLFYPETEESKTTRKEDLIVDTSNDSNVIEALSQGAITGISLVGNISANLISFLAFLHLINDLLSWLGSLVGIEDFTFERVLSYLFLPLAYVMGCDGSFADVLLIARLMGVKTFFNEFLAFSQMGENLRNGKISPRNRLLATFALCGFSNIGSIGIQLGLLSALSPERKSDLAEMAVRSLVAGTICCFITACVAGLLVNETAGCATHLFLSSNCTKV